MLKKPLIETNPHLRSPQKYRKSLITNVSSSSAIEADLTVQAIAQLLAAATPFEQIKKRKASSQ